MRAVIPDGTMVGGIDVANGPTWYVLLQAGIGLVQFVIRLGLVQFVIGLAMISGLRRAGVWGAFGWR